MIEGGETKPVVLVLRVAAGNIVLNQPYTVDYSSILKIRKLVPKPIKFKELQNPFVVSSVCASSRDHLTLQCNFRSLLVRESHSSGKSQNLMASCNMKLLSQRRSPICSMSHLLPPEPSHREPKSALGLLCGLGGFPWK